MAELSPEERERIYQEEKARNEAQGQLKKEEATAKSQKAQKGCLGCLGLTFVIFVVLYAIGTFTTDTVSPPGGAPTTAASKPTPEPLEVVGSITFINAESGSRIAGTVKNNSQKQYRYVQVQFNLYDKSGAQVGSSLANVNNLEPGGSWKFEAHVFEKRATSAKLKDVTGF